MINLIMIDQCVLESWNCQFRMTDLLATKYYGTIVSRATLHLNRSATYNFKFQNLLYFCPNFSHSRKLERFLKSMPRISLQFHSMTFSSLPDFLLLELLQQYCDQSFSFFSS